jgi:hypothetical protein
MELQLSEERCSGLEAAESESARRLQDGETLQRTLMQVGDTTSIACISGDV